MKSLLIEFCYYTGRLGLVTKLFVKISIIINRFLGKTTLAKALVFKLSTRLYFLQHHLLPNTKSSDSSPSNPLYDRLQCLTIHSNQLFSRFFSESAKSVQRLFELIKSLAIQPGNFVCVLIDEVETLAMSRKQSAEAGSSEPTDSIRVQSLVYRHYYLLSCHGSCRLSILF
jgi:SpoVK/Ycf46/Vps4 family AAA+-type ATPase